MEKKGEKEPQLISVSQPEKAWIDFTAFIIPLDWLEKGDALVVHDNKVLEGNSPYQGLRMWCEFSALDRIGDYALEMIFYQDEEYQPPTHRFERDKIADTYLARGIWQGLIKLTLTKEEVSRLGGGELFDLELLEGLGVQTCIGRTCSQSTLLVETMFYSPERSFRNDNSIV